MEIQNQNIQPNLPAEQPKPKNIWFDKKHVITYIIVSVGLLVIGGAIFAYQKQIRENGSLSATGCGAKEAQEVVVKKNLQAARNCNVEDIQVDSKPAKLVGITYGPGMDCPSGCIYDYYMGFLLNGKLTDFQGEPEIYPIFTDTYGDWCNVQNRDVFDNPKVVKSIISVEGKYYWAYHFNNFDNQERINSLLQTSQILKSKDNAQYCILNGEMVITEISYSYAKKIDFSKLDVQFKPMP